MRGKTKAKRRWVYFVCAALPRLWYTVNDFHSSQRVRSFNATIHHRSDYEYRVKIDSTVFKMFFRYDRQLKRYFTTEHITFRELDKMATIKAYFIWHNCAPKEVQWRKAAIDY